MKGFVVSSIVTAWAAIAAAAPPLSVNGHSHDDAHDRDRALSQPNSYHAGTGAGPCDLSSEDTGCYLIMDNSGCFLNTSDTARVLGCADSDPTKAIDIFCRCWGCNGQELVNFMPTLNCTSKTVIPTPAKPAPISGNGTASAPHGNGSHPVPGPAP
ncbi:hypothetical protein SPBR_06230 [Sporothrix brasiliensis 5110]|uniref:Uncharacterized protein n=1 Tax=Sporothrix brasiliensis 5110 TaxID=1398154 RepID=A0A0C2F4N1_9PEZI|nr:uncharacterized protein SPBR_06230 [Sporothrix brasiliensis 5110]KIH93884.1 hypothetical protein SPBR_06230 [Sporothrix brasiliensis 5110]